MAMQPAIARQNGRGVWLYNQLPAIASQISSLQRWTPFFADAGICRWNASSSRIRTSRSDQLVDSVIPCSHPASIQRASLRANFTALMQMHHYKTCRSPLLKNSGAEDLSSRWLASLRRLNAHVPRHHNRESICLPSISVPLRLRATGSRSVWVTMNWMTAFLCYRSYESYRALWLTPPFGHHLLHVKPVITAWLK